MYARPNNMYKAYQQNDILTLSPVAIIERLYQAMERSLYAAKDAVEKRQPAIKGEKLGHALAIIGELQASLDMNKGGEIAQNLYDLYTFSTARLLMANVRDDVAIIDEVIRTMKPLSEAWGHLRQEQQHKAANTTVQEPDGVSEDAIRQETMHVAAAC